MDNEQMEMIRDSLLEWPEPQEFKTNESFGNFVLTIPKMKNFTSAVSNYEFDVHNISDRTISRIFKSATSDNSPYFTSNASYDKWDKLGKPASFYSHDTIIKYNKISSRCKKLYLMRVEPGFDSNGRAVCFNLFVDKNSENEVSEAALEEVKDIILGKLREKEILHNVGASIQQINYYKAIKTVQKREGIHPDIFQALCNTDNLRRSWMYKLSLAHVDFTADEAISDSDRTNPDIVYKHMFLRQDHMRWYDNSDTFLSNMLLNIGAFGKHANSVYTFKLSQNLWRSRIVDLYYTGLKRQGFTVDMEMPTFGKEIVRRIIKQGNTFFDVKKAEWSTEQYYRELISAALNLPSYGTSFERKSYISSSDLIRITYGLTTLNGELVDDAHVKNVRPNKTGTRIYTPADWRNAGIGGNGYHNGTLLPMDCFIDSRSIKQQRRWNVQYTLARIEIISMLILARMVPVMDGVSLRVFDYNGNFVCTLGAL